MIPVIDVGSMKAEGSFIPTADKTEVRVMHKFRIVIESDIRLESLLNLIILQLDKSGVKHKVTLE